MTPPPSSGEQAEPDVAGSGQPSPGPSRLRPAQPFPGLRPFEREDADWFFGRQKQAFALYRLLDRGRFVTIVGGSGSGKSSVVRAGLLHLLDRETEEEGGSSWSWWSIRPGDAPLKRLASCLAGPPGEESPAARRKAGEGPPQAEAEEDRIGRMLRRSSFGLSDVLEEQAPTGCIPVLVVDQFEEIFRFADLPGRETERARRREEATLFVQLLLEAARSPDGEARIVLTMRSDYLGDCARFDGLPEAVTASQFLVPGMKRRQREEAIRGPVEKAGGEIEPALVQRLLEDGGNGMDQLPVLAHCMARLWSEAGKRQQDGVRRLILDDYQAIGRLDGALSRHADEILEEPAMAERAELVEAVFRALTEIDRGRGVRRPLRFERLAAETGAEAAELEAVLDRLRAFDCSFLLPVLPQTLEAATVIDISHEALIRNWRRLSPSVWAGEAGTLGGIAEQPRGWLWEEAQDGDEYRSLVSFYRGSADDWILPRDQVEARLAWWSRRRRTPAWAERHVSESGGGFDRVVRLLETSKAAHDADAERLLDAERMAKVRAMLDACAEPLPIWDVYVVALILRALSERTDGQVSFKSLALEIGAGCKAVATLCNEAAHIDGLLELDVEGARFASLAARREARSWSDALFMDPPFGCFVDLRDRSIIAFHKEGYILGRKFENSLSDRSISRAHLVLFYSRDENRTELADLRSVNGSTLNGVPVAYGENLPDLRSGDVVGLAGVVPFVFVAAKDFGALAAMDRDVLPVWPFGVPRPAELEGIWGYAVTADGATPLRGAECVIDDRSIVSARGAENGPPLALLAPSDAGGVLVKILADSGGIALWYRVKGLDEWLHEPLAKYTRLHVAGSEVPVIAGFDGIRVPTRLQIGEIFVEIFAAPGID